MRAQNFFTDAPKGSTPYADHDSAESVESAAYDTSDVDKFRHGVEIRTTRQYVAGSVKILSGEAGHALASLAPAQDALVARAVDAPFSDLADGVFSVSSDDDITGVIDAIGVRPSTALTTQLLSESRALGITGHLTDRESSQDRGGDVKSVDEWITKNSGAAFRDDTDRDGTGADVGVPTIGSYFDVDSVSADFFGRECWPSQAPSGVDADVVSILISFTQTGDSYVKSWTRSACCGHTYSDSAGTDSVAFGDMTYR